jgi:hypothetical protein
MRSIEIAKDEQNPSALVRINFEHQPMRIAKLTKSNHFYKRVGFHFIADGCRLAMARINNHIFVQGI